jgi:hypothetical protein
LKRAREQKTWVCYVYTYTNIHSTFPLHKLIKHIVFHQEYEKAESARLAEEEANAKKEQHKAQKRAQKKAEIKSKMENTKRKVRHLLSMSSINSCNSLILILRQSHLGRMLPVYTQERPTHVKTHKLLQICSEAVDKLSSHCLFPVVVTSLMALSDLSQGCSKSLINKNVTRLTTQGCNNVAIS